MHKREREKSVRARWPENNRSCLSGVQGIGTEIERLRGTVLFKPWNKTLSLSHVIVYIPCDNLLCLSSFVPKYEYDETQCKLWSILDVNDDDTMDLGEQCSRYLHDPLPKLCTYLDPLMVYCKVLISTFSVQFNSHVCCLVFDSSILMYVCFVFCSSILMYVCLFVLCFLPVFSWCSCGRQVMRSRRCISW